MEFFWTPLKQNYRVDVFDIPVTKLLFLLAPCACTGTAVRIGNHQAARVHTPGS